MASSQRIKIICVGNILLLDEGFGPRVAEALLAGYDFPDEVEVLDCGVLGMAMLAELRSAEEVLIIDALDNTGYPPGTILTFKPEDLGGRQVFHGAHDMRLADVLDAAELLGATPKVSCLGVQVADIAPEGYQIGLTPAVEAAVPKVCELVAGWLAERGIEATQREEAGK